jgi:DNA (cytosine-5)-methyltransferase 1
MKYCSVCSGVEAASLAWEMLGWEPVFFAEVEPFPSAVLMQKFGATKPLNPLDPELAGSKKEKKQRENWKKQIEKFSQGGTIPNLGDLTKIKGDNYRGAVDILIGGTPCQGFSVAGQRKGLDDERSCMAIKFLELVDTIRPGWVVWENVPGVISSWSGEPEDETITEWEERNDLDQFFAGFRQCGYNIAWRVLDTQYVRVEPGFS